MNPEAPEYQNGTPLYIPTNVTDRASVDAMVEKTVAHFGGLDGIVNNAGINIPRLLVDEGHQYELDEAVWDKVMNVNLKGLFFCAQSAARVLVQQRHGVIVNMSSESGLEGSEGQSVYAASKNAVNSLTRSWAQEHGCETVAFPLISSGIFGYPKDQALRVAVDTIGAFLLEHDMTVYLVIFDRRAYQISGKLFADIAEYIDDHYVEAHTDPGAERLRRGALHREMAAPMCAPMAAPALDNLLEHLDAGFSETLLRLIDRSRKKDSEVYKKANVDRKLFSKIRNNPNYKPSKPTALAFAIALELDLEETKDLLARAGYALSASSKFDVIVEYFIRQRNYDIFAINEALFAFDQSLLGA